MLSVLFLNNTKIVAAISTPVRMKNKTITSSKFAIYPAIIGNVIRANEPAEANQPSKTPCGLLPTTEQTKIRKASMLVS